jgi:phosphatidylinositol-3-phosphatase
VSRRFVLGFAVVAALVASVIGAQADSSGEAAPHVKHVFIVVLENENGDQTFGPDTQIPYLAQTMRSEGAYIPNYYGTAHNSLANYIAMISGQGPNLFTQADCPLFTQFLPGLPFVPGLPSNGQYIGQGCLYPPGVQNIATQLEGNGYTWKGYMQDMANSAPDQPASCRHPAVNGPDSTQTAKPTDQYAARHNPFVYFESIIDFPTCQQNDVDLGQLQGDLDSEATTADYSFITPDLCNDGHDGTGAPGSCADGGPGGMVEANSFLQEWVPRITSSPAFQDNGLLLVTFDEAEGGSSPLSGDASACCDEQPGFNTINPGALTIGPGGGKVGAVALSPCIEPGTTTDDAYNHYSLLRWVEDNFELPRLGFARQATGVNGFDAKVLSDPTCTPGAGEGTTTGTTTTSTDTTTTSTDTTTTSTDTTTATDTTTTAGTTSTDATTTNPGPPEVPPQPVKKKHRKHKKHHHH